MDISLAKLRQDLKLKVIVIYVEEIALALRIRLELLRCEFDGVLIATYGMGLYIAVIG